jgi:hypothetical protein
VKHVTVGKAIDWQQWQLDQSVRSIRFQVDKDNDLYALPVVVIDPTGALTTAPPSNYHPITWREGVALAGFGPFPLHLPVLPQTISYICGLGIDYEDVRLVAAAAVTGSLLRVDTGAPVATHRFWVDVAANFKPSHTIDLRDFPIPCPLGVMADTSAVVLGQYTMYAWGYDA